MDNLQWKSHWVHANPSERGKHRIVVKGGQHVSQKKVNGTWTDQPAMTPQRLLAGKPWKI